MCELVAILSSRYKNSCCKGTCYMVWHNISRIVLVEINLHIPMWYLEGDIISRKSKFYFEEIYDDPYTCTMRNHFYSYFYDRNSIFVLVTGSYTGGWKSHSRLKIRIVWKIIEEDRFKLKTIQKISSYSMAMGLCLTPLWIRSQT